MNATIFAAAATVCAALLLGTPCSAVEKKAGATAARLEIHEWGTFTSLQDENGNAIGGINTDDEPVPKFVHDIARGFLIRPTEAPPSFFQGAPSCHPDVTMRLETPVLYVHAGKGEHPRLNVSVSFRGGWLTQFYPDAAVTAPGVDQARWSYGPLSAATVGKLVWKNLEVNSASTGPATDAHVWLAPRNVEAAALRTETQESEKFLFYRGVGHLDAPLRVVGKAGEHELEIRASAAEFKTGRAGPLWLADIRANGTAACRKLSLDNSNRAASGPVAIADSRFEEASYSAAGMEGLRAELKTALVGEGLFADEAEALLETWKLSYFKSAGMRLFFLVPRAWTDAVLPLEVDGAPPTVRVMVGRIELVTPAQRQLLKRIAQGPVPDSYRDLRAPADVLWQTGKVRDWNALNEGNLKFSDVGIKPPPVYQAYLDLGRFRNALLLEEQRRNPSANVEQFINNFRLEGYDR
jgi:hypothetical protein